jgi:hypothetical protein
MNSNFQSCTNVSLLLTLFLILLTSNEKLGYCQTIPGSNKSNWVKHTIIDRQKTAINSAVANDFDRDGKLDIIASYQGGVFLHRGTDWQPVKIYSFDSANSRNKPGKACIHSCLIDVDQDGDLDFIGSNQTLFWLECPEKPLSGIPWIYRTIDDEMLGSHCVLAADVDGNGAMDLIANSFHDEEKTNVPRSIAWLEIPANPRNAKQWKRHVFADRDAPGGSHYMGFGDLNGDGRGDITCGAKGQPFTGGEWFAWWEQPVDPRGPWKKHLLAENQPGASNINPVSIDGDDTIDIVATRGHGTGVFWFRGPNFRPIEIDSKIEGPHTLVTSDLDGDQDIDIAVCGRTTDGITMWYQNDGSGNFNPSVIDRNQGSYDLRAIDMDGDGDLDLLSAGHQNNNVVWYENQVKQVRDSSR